MVREIYKDELGQLLELYLHLHEDSLPEDNEALNKAWSEIINDKNHHIVVKVVDGLIVSSCVCVVIPNLTRNARPYALIENVVTRKEHRGKGYGTECLDRARIIAKEAGCYKLMLLTGSQDESTHAFYRKVGYNSADKTAYIQWL